MATTHVQLNRNNQFGSEITHLINAYRKVNADGPNIIAAMACMIDGNGSDEAHFTEMVTLGIYENTADAKASFDELSSINFKLTTNASVSDCDAALKQVCSKHGII